MDEAFLHFIWKFQYFYKQDLATTSGLPVQVVRQGIHNHDAGPDFLNARVVIDNMEWNGSVEIHINEKDWHQHGHETDKAYDNVVLHVVWNANATDTHRSDGTTIPVIELKDKVDHSLLERYQKLVSANDNVLCGKQIGKIDKLKVFETLDKVVVERLQKKAEEIMVRLRKNGNDWEETAFQLLAANFGFKINKDPFLDLAEKIPFKILRKHSDNLIQVEAILFGLAGFLESQAADAYVSILKKEFDFLQNKYRFSKILARHQWKFLRLRPANFPTIRLAQFARLLSEHQNFFSMFLSVKDIKTLKENLQCVQSEYWQHHYDFEKKTEKQVGSLGDGSINNIIINTCVPLLAAYSMEKDEQEYLDRALVFLQNINPEKNKIVNEWTRLGIRISSAFDSQASIELMNSYCLKKRCPDCNIGAAILQKT